MPTLELPTGLEGTDRLPRTNTELRNMLNNGNGLTISRPGIPLIADVGGVSRGGFEWNGDLYYVYSQELRKFTDRETGTFSVIGVIEGPENIDHAIGVNEAVIIVKGGKSYTLSKSSIFVNITSVSDVGGNASFNYSGAGPKLGDVVTIKDFIKVANVAYNGTFTVTAAIASTSFEVGVAFGEDETVGSFTNVLVDTSGNPNFVPFISVTHLRDRFIYVQADGLVFKFSEVGDGGTIDALSFVKSAIDAAVAFVLKDYLYIGGSDETIRYKDTGAFPTPYREVGGSFDIGFIGGLVEADQSVIFVGRKRGQSPGIFEMGSRQVIKISNEAVDLILTTYTELELSETIGGRINWLNSYDFETLELRRDSLLFFEGRWSRTNTIIDNVSRPWLGGFIVEIDNEYFSASDGRFGKFTDTNFDYGNRITRIQKGTITHPDRDNFSIASLELGVSQGFNDGEAQSVGLRTSDNGILFGQTVFRELGLTGQYNQRLIWNDPGGLGNYEGFMAYELVTTGNLTFNSDSLIVDFGE